MVALALDAALELALELAVCTGGAEVNRFLYISGMSPDSMLFHFDKEGNWPDGFDAA
jgi:hypothetical protein